MKTLIKYLIIFNTPFVVFTFLYVYKDPFKVLYHYDSYYNSNQVNPIYLNKDHVSTQTLVNNIRKNSNNYNSFILGNSKTMFLNTKSWCEKIKEIENRCYHFDASAETLLGLRNKVVFLDKNNIALKNILISLDYSTIRKDFLGDRQLNINSYLNTEEISKIYFQYVHLKTFFNAKFFFPYLLYLSQKGELSEYMYKFRIFDNKKISYNKLTNEIRYQEIDSMIANNSYHDSKKLAELTDNSESFCPPSISQSHLDLLVDIKKILDKHNSNYTIIIPPSYDKMKLAPEDLKKIQDIFDKELVHDFSGKNQITINKKLYYEQTHFVPKVWDMILDSVYQKEN